MIKTTKYNLNFGCYLSHKFACFLNEFLKQISIALETTTFNHKMKSEKVQIPLMHFGYVEKVLQNSYKTAFAYDFYMMF